MMRQAWKTIVVSAVSVMALAWGGHFLDARGALPQIKKCNTPYLDTADFFDPSGFPATERRFTALTLNTSRVLILAEASVNKIPKDLPRAWSDKAHITVQPLARAGDSLSQYYYVAQFDTPLSVCDLLRGMDEWERYLRTQEKTRHNNYMRIVPVFFRDGVEVALDLPVTVIFAKGVQPDDFEANVISQFVSERRRTAVRGTLNPAVRGETGDSRMVVEPTPGRSSLWLGLRLADMRAWISHVELSFFPIESAITTQSRIELLRNDGTARSFFENEVPSAAAYALPGWRWVVDIDLRTDAYQFLRDLSQGDHGADVRALQAFLIRRSSKQRPAARALAERREFDFGLLTRNALAEYQTQALHVPASGQLDSETRRRVMAAAEPYYRLLTDANGAGTDLKNRFMPQSDGYSFEIADPGCAENIVSSPDSFHERHEISCIFTVSNAGDFTLMPVMIRAENRATGTIITVYTERQLRIHVANSPATGIIPFLPESRVIEERTTKITPVPASAVSRDAGAADAINAFLASPVRKASQTIQSFWDSCLSRFGSCASAHAFRILNGLLWTAIALAVVLAVFFSWGNRSSMIRYATQALKNGWKFVFPLLWVIPRTIRKDPAKGWKTLLSFVFAKDLVNASAERIGREFNVDIENESFSFFDVEARTRSEPLLRRLVRAITLEERHALNIDLAGESAMRVRFRKEFSGTIRTVFRMWRDLRARS